MFVSFRKGRDTGQTTRKALFYTDLRVPKRYGTVGDSGDNETKKCPGVPVCPIGFRDS